MARSGGGSPIGLWAGAVTAAPAANTPTIPKAAMTKLMSAMGAIRFDIGGVELGSKPKIVKLAKFPSHTAPSPAQAFPE